jgi:hypothetical protein
MVIPGEYLPERFCVPDEDGFEEGAGFLETTVLEYSDALFDEETKLDEDNTLDEDNALELELTSDNDEDDTSEEGADELEFCAGLVVQPANIEKASIQLSAMLIDVFALRFI